MTETILSIVFALLTVALVLYNHYVSIRKKIEGSVLTEINNAEDMDLTGEEKKAYVVETLYKIVPTYYKRIIKKDFIELLVQTTFDEVESFAKKQN